MVFSLSVYCLCGLFSLQHFNHITSSSFDSLTAFNLFNFTENILCDLLNRVFKIWDTCNGVKVTPWTASAGKVALSGSWSIFPCTSEIFPSLNASKTKVPGGVSKTEGMHAALNTDPQLLPFGPGENFNHNRKSCWLTKVSVLDCISIDNAIITPVPIWILCEWSK